MNQKILKSQEIMRFEEADCWLMYCDEHSDPHFSNIVSSHTIVPSLAILTQSACFLIVHTLDAENVIRDKNIDLVTYDNDMDLLQRLRECLTQVGMPQRILLNYSTMRDAQVDVLGFGIYKFLVKEVGDIYSASNRVFEFGSAEKIIYAFYDRKEAGEVEKIKIAASRALEIIEEAFEKIRPGMSEIDVVELVHSIAEHKPKYFKEVGVTNQDYAWDKALCPIVLSGPNLTKGGHSQASQSLIEKGQTLYFDFGVQLTFEDGSKWSSDIQRMGYLLKDDEKVPPASIVKMFDTLIEAISLGISAIKPGMRGYEVDALVRQKILAGGYPDYGHATGHAIGETPHSPGTLLGPLQRNLSQLRIQPNGVYSIEPRIAIDNGGSVEEMVLVRSDDVITLCPRQTSLYLIR